MAKARFCAFGLAIALLAIASSCSRTRDANSLKITGSDTMVNLAAAWQERYKDVQPEVRIQVKGGGSGVGIAALCSGRIDIATASRPLKAEEAALAKERTGKEPREFIVGQDALAIFVHLSNPLESITIPQLAEIYGEGGRITQWGDLDIDHAACDEGEIIRISRQNSSGTYVYFQEAVLGKGREYKQGATSQSGSSDVVTLISNTPCAIGYSGMGYRSDAVKMLRVAKQEGQSAIEPSKATTLDGSYPISRPLFLYTLGEPEGRVKEFIEWVQSRTGQQVVERLGYVPLKENHGSG
ncbi:MAG: phosphate ABC transporter substrate-binding protein [Pirellulales bacterium]